MNVLGNILWIVFGGVILALLYFIGGIMLCITIVGIPFGVQAFKIGAFALLPFGRKTVVSEKGSGCLAAFFNILWIVTFGLCLAVGHLVFGVLMFATIIGIPFGLQHFKLMAVALAPFGRRIVSC